MKKLTINILVLTFILMQSCKQSFDDKDMQTINLYNVGDTLIFKNINEELDSFTIVSKEIRYNGLSEGYSGNTQTCWIEYQKIPSGKPRLVSFGGQQGDVYSQNKSFLSATKWDDNKPARVDIKFGGFGGNLPQIDSLKKNNEFYKYFHLTHFCYNCNGVDSTDIVEIIWTPDKGIVQYMKKNKTIWRLIE